MTLSRVQDGDERAPAQGIERDVHQMARKDTAQSAQDAPQDAQSAPKPKTPPKTIGPATLARIASERLGRAITAKRVRSVARDVLDRYIAAESGGQRTTYTAHAYTPDEARDVLAALAGKGRGGPTATLDEAEALLSDGGEE